MEYDDNRPADATEQGSEDSQSNNITGNPGLPGTYGNPDRGEGGAPPTAGAGGINREPPQKFMAPEKPSFIQHHPALPGNSGEAGGNSPSDRAKSKTEKKKSQLVEPEPLHGPIEVLALTRHEDGDKDWGYVVKFKNADDLEVSLTIPSRLFAGQGRSEVIGMLRNAGLWIAANATAEQRVCDLIVASKPTARRTTVTRVGWHGESYIWPDAITAKNKSAEQDIVLMSDRALGNPYKVNGTLSEWQNEVAHYGQGNALLTFALSAAFVGPLLKILDAESGGFHFYGPSSIGKTTLLTVAGSVCGKTGPNGYVETWRATDNGLEGIASLHNDNLLCLDEIAQVDPTVAAHTAYMLANGQGKLRATQTGLPRDSFRWSLLFLSSGEIPIESKIAEKPWQRVTAGQVVRLIDIRADTGRYGIFEELHGFESPGKLADHLRRSARNAFGMPIRDYVKNLVELDHASLVKLDKTIFSRFEKQMLGNDSGQVQRVMKRFSLVATAGELAACYRILPFQNEECLAAAEKVYQTWREERGNSGAFEVESGIKQIRSFFQIHRQRFSILGKEEWQTVNQCAGQLVMNGEEISEFRIFPEVFQNEICKGLNYRFLARTLADRGFLIKDGNGQLQRVVNIRGRRQRMYVIDASILEE